MTDWGLTSVKPGAPMAYEIPAERLLEKRNCEDGFYDWPAHVGEKTWIDYGKFADAY